MFIYVDFSQVFKHCDVGYNIKLGFFGLLLLYIIKRYLKWCDFRNKINRIPGPDYYPILGNLKELVLKSPSIDVDVGAARMDMFEFLFNRFGKGELYRLWYGTQPVVYPTSAKSVEAVLNSLACVNKGDPLNLTKSWLGNSIFLRKGDKWRSRRKELTPAFHLRILDDFLPVMNIQSEILIEKLKEKQKEPYIDILLPILHCAIDVISETAMGIQIKCQTEPDAEFCKAFSRNSNLFAERFLRPWLWNEKIYGLTKDGREFKKNIDITRNFMKKLIRDRKEKIFHSEKLKEDIKEDNNNVYLQTPKKRKFFLDLLLDNHLANAELSETDIIDEVISFMFAGHDTTAVSLVWILFVLGHHPEIQQRVFNEIVEVCGSSYLNVTMDQIKELTYMEMVIKEGQRLYPAVPGFIRYVQDDVKIDQYTVPKGASAFIYTYFLNRNPEVFPNPNEFIPERFSKENSDGRNPYAYVPFAAGQRNCLGKRYAMLEMKIILSHVIKNFRLISVDSIDKVRCASKVTLRPIGPIRIKITPRE